MTAKKPLALAAARYTILVRKAILAIAIAAMLAGANGLRAIFRWGRRLKPEALVLFGIECASHPQPRR